MDHEFSIEDLKERATAVEPTFLVHPGLYIVGSLERGLTVYNQQLRAHNLVWALWELHKHNEGESIRRVAIVGGGIAGLTTAACFVSLFKNASITLFEQLWDLCPLQQGSDNRWLHPRIYEWPDPGSRAPGASLPVLNWSEGRASDVARMIVSEFGKFVDAFDEEGKRLRVLLGLRHFQINAAQKRIDWIANRTTRRGAFFHIAEAAGDSEIYDIVVLSAGFGLENQSQEYPTNSYWRNEQLGQPLLDGSRQDFVVSGFGDGALIDLCRLTIERYRQDTILYELFPNNLEEVEEKLTAAWNNWGRGRNAFEFFNDFEEPDILENARVELSRRIRKDTRVSLHIRGKNQDVKRFADIFGPYSSFLNRMMTFLLFKCGAFSFSMEELEFVVRRHATPHANVLCRYGTDALGHLHSMFSDIEIIKDRLMEIKTCQKQRPQRLWAPGTFPDPSHLKG
jgi:hypothetical protein